MTAAPAGGVPISYDLKHIKGELHRPRLLADVMACTLAVDAQGAQSGLDLPARAKYPPARRNVRTGAAGRVWWYFIDMSMADNYHQSMNAEQVLQKALMMENAEAEKFIFSALEKGDITGKELQDAVHQRLLNDEPINLKCLMQSPSIITRWWARQARKDGHRYPLA